MCAFVITARRLRKVTLAGLATGLGLVPIGPGPVPVQARYGAVFASPGTPVVEQDECRGIRLLVARNCLVTVQLIEQAERSRFVVMVH